MLLPSNNGCPDFLSTQLTRRHLLRIGSLSLFGLSLADWARAAARVPGVESASPQSPHSPRAAAQPAAGPRTPVRSIILLQHYGGPSQLDTWDPKPDAPAEIRGEFGTIPTTLPGLRVADIMPRAARLCHKLTLIRSMTHRVANHNPATYLALTGRTSALDQVQVGTAPTDWPALGAVLSKLRPGDGKLPDFVQLPHVAYDQVYTTPGQFGGLLGKRYDPLVIQQDPSRPDFRVEELSLPADLSADRLLDRRSLLNLVDAQIRRFESNPAAQGLDTFYQRAWSILTSPEAKRAFDLAQEPAKLRDAYGRNKVGQSYLLSRRLVEAGVRFVTCLNGISPSNGWDTHAENFPQLKNKLVPPDDQAYSALLEDLDARGLLDSTLVIWAGEFGRNPRIGRAGFTNLIFPGGRDHWPSCYTVVLAGGGTKRGFLYSSSDKIAAYPAERPVTPADLAATLFWAVGIDPALEIRDQLGRPFRLADGAPVRDLFA